MSYPQDLADVLKALETFQSVPARQDVGPYLATWSFDQGDMIPFTVVSGPISLGNPTIQKFWRQLEFFGDGWVHAMVFCDGQFLTSGHAQMTSNPTGHRFIGLPRGSKGYELNVVMTVMGRLDNLMTHADLVGNIGKDS